MTDERDNPVAAYVEAAAPPGSPDYYALLFTDAGQRPALSAGLALGKVIINIASQRGETDILRLKLTWWHDEVRATREGQARHPLTKYLAMREPQLRWLPALQSLIASADSVVAAGPVATLAAVLRRAHGMAERQAFLSAIAGHEDDESLGVARTAGVGIALTELLRERRLPAAAFATGDDSRNEISAPKLAAIAVEHYDASDLRGRPGSAAVTLVLQALLHRMFLDRLLRDRFDPRRADLNPLRMLWHAWREARRLHL